jgi:hypothetical protein
LGTTSPGTGNVGIGTASPSRLLQLNSSGQTDLHLTSTNQGVGASDGMTIFLDASGTGGLWLREAAALRFATSSSERMRIDASGNVGIGVTSIPGWANLITSGTVAVGGMLYIKSNNFIQGLSGFPGSSDKLIINPDGGNVGIGTTAPASKLHVNGGIGTYTSDWVTTVSGSRLLMKTFAGTGDTYSLIQAQDVGGNSNNALVLQPYGDNVGIGTTNPLSILHVVSREIGNGANKGIRIENYNGTKDYSIRTGVSGIENTSLAFYDETAGANRIVITSGGNVGIGTVSPGQRLEVDGNTLINNSGDGKLYLGSTSDYIGNIGSDIYMYSSGQNIFYAGGSEKMRITTAGNVGIGTTSPNHKLDIYSNENVPLRIHRPSNANLDSSGAWGIGFSTRGDAATSTSDTRAGIFSYYNGNIFLAAANTSIVADPDAYARLTILNAGSIKFNSYDSTNQTGTPTYLLGTDASGNIVKTNTVPGSAAGPYLPLAGGTMTGTIIQNGGNIDFSDGRSANFGNGDDLQIYHDGSNSYIKDTGVGSLYIGASAFRLTNAASTENIIAGYENAQVDLYYDNSKKFETTTTGVTVTGGGIFTGDVSGVAGTFTGNLAVGTASSAEIYLNRNSANYINAANATGYLVFRTAGAVTALTLSAAQTQLFQGMLQ